MARSRLLRTQRSFLNRTRVALRKPPLYQEAFWYRGGFLVGLPTYRGAMDLDSFEQLDPNPAATQIKRMLQDIILWNERTSPRSLQRAIGPSEIGDPCDRRIAYRLAGTEPVNVYGDPWPAIVGTAIHSWLETAINRFQAETGHQGWVTEARVQPDPLVQGRSDVFYERTGTVVDFKTTSSDTIKKLNRGDPPSPSYVTQINLYGRGHELAGRDVKNVCLVYYARSGWLNDAFVWHDTYKPEIAARALTRMYDIGFHLLDLDIENRPEKFADILPTPGDNCIWCPMFSRDMDPTVKASRDGCPGR